MTLLTGIGGAAWSTAAEKLALPYLRTVVIGEPAVRDVYGYWRAVADRDGLSEAGALLVRPDGYIAWRHRDAQWETDAAVLLLEEALGAVLGR